MNIIYLLFHGLSPYSGISKKILYQVKGLEACGHQVSLCTLHSGQQSPGKDDKR